MFNEACFKYAAISVVFIAISSIQPYTVFPIGNTTMWWGVQAVILGLFWRLSTLVQTHMIPLYFVIYAYLFWNCFSFIHGLFIVETYWDVKGLVSNGMALMLPLVVFAFGQVRFTRLVIKAYIKYALPLFLFFMLIIGTDAYGKYLGLISSILLYFSVLKKKWQWIIGGVSCFVLMVDLGARSNVIRFGVAFLLSLVYYVRHLIPEKSIELARLFLMLIPLLLFYIGVIGVFNVFKMDEYLEGKHTTMRVDSSGELVEDDLAADTRTFLYVDVLNTAKKYNTWLIGRSPARGNESDSFGAADMNGRNERLRNEVGILNVFTWTGSIGVLLYFLVFWRASFLAINRSSNFYSKMLGLFVAFRWAYAWVEDINSFTLNYFLLWMMMGMCFSPAFRAMSDFEMKLWVRSIFETKYEYLSIKYDEFKLKNTKL